MTTRGEPRRSTADKRTPAGPGRGPCRAGGGGPVRDRTAPVGRSPAARQGPRPPGRLLHDHEVRWMATARAIASAMRPSDSSEVQNGGMRVEHVPQRPQQHAAVEARPAHPPADVREVAARDVDLDRGDRAAGRARPSPAAGPRAGGALPARTPRSVAWQRRSTRRRAASASSRRRPQHASGWAGERVAVEERLRAVGGVERGDDVRATRASRPAAARRRRASWRRRSGRGRSPACSMRPQRARCGRRRSSPRRR